MKRLLLASTIVLLSQKSIQAQTPDLGPLNAAFNGSVIFKVDKHGRLVMDHYDQGSRFRQDVVPMEQIDPGLTSFSSEEDAIALKCKAEKGQCFSKEIFKLDVVRLSSRITVPRPPQDESGANTIALFQELLAPREATIAPIAAETSASPSRKNNSER
ncbi:MAG: hypothetical protein JNN32_07175 [Flavobacteriales bacterium]|nr:hypothetical protein [Flavobacteriales bacterium]